MWPLAQQAAANPWAPGANPEPLHRVGGGGWGVDGTRLVRLPKAQPPWGQGLSLLQHEDPPSKET